MALVLKIGNIISLDSDYQWLWYRSQLESTLEYQITIFMLTPTPTPNSQHSNSPRNKIKIKQGLILFLRVAVG